MSSDRRAALAGTGCYLPKRVLSNAELATLVDTSDEWIRSRTGISERRVAAADETTSTMAAEAARRACCDCSIPPDELDLIIVATSTPDYPFPSTACLVQHAIGARRAAAFDLQAACSGFIYGTSVASGMIASGMVRNALVIGADTMTRFVDYSDRRSCILFGDGAGAAVYRASANGSGVLHSKLAADGSQSSLVSLPAGGSRLPASCETVTGRQHFIQMQGKQVFRFAVEALTGLLREAMDTCQLEADDVRLVVPHQVNGRIIDAAVERSAIPRERWFMNICRYGNTAAASLPIALAEARSKGLLKKGDTAILLGFGAGLTWGASVLRV